MATKTVENPQYVRYSIQIQTKKCNVNQVNGTYILITIQPHCLPFMASKYKAQYFSADMCDDLTTQLHSEKNKFNVKKNWKKEHTEVI